MGESNLNRAKSSSNRCEPDVPATKTPVVDLAVKQVGCHTSRTQMYIIKEERAVVAPSFCLSETMKLIKHLLCSVHVMYVTAITKAFYISLSEIYDHKSRRMEF